MDEETTTIRVSLTLRNQFKSWCADRNVTMINKTNELLQNFLDDAPTTPRKRVSKKKVNRE